MNAPPLYKHQEEAITFFLQHTRTFCTSDPGTGKTRAVLETLKRRNHIQRTLIVAPKTILEPAWAEDIKKFTPELTYSIAYAPHRKQAFEENTQIVLINHDGVKWVLENQQVLRNFNTLICDEVTAFKHHTSQRSKALAKLKDHFDYRIALTGTPTANGLLGLWHQLYLIDDGRHLGNSFYRFRNAICDQFNRGSFTEWVEKEEAKIIIPTMIQDINIRHKFEDCIDIPKNKQRTIKFNLSKAHHNIYKKFLKHALAEIDTHTISAINAAVLNNKLLQIASGAVYDTSGETVSIDKTRYKLIIDLIKEREQSIVAFNWNHQREELIKLAKKQKIPYGTIDGQSNTKLRNEAITNFQKGNIQVIFAHPQSASHGLTLTKGTATIWASPLYNLEFYEQFNRRIYRAGQLNPTETIHVCANNTLDEIIYEKLATKTENHQLVLQLLQNSQ